MLDVVTAQQRITELYVAHARNEELRHVLALYMDAVRALRALAEALLRCGAERWAQGAAVQMRELVTQAERHARALLAAR
jgi:hypothetical protein